MKSQCGKYWVSGGTTYWYHPSQENTGYIHLSDEEIRFNLYINLKKLIIDSYRTIRSYEAMTKFMGDPHGRFYLCISDEKKKIERYLYKLKNYEKLDR